MTIEQTEVVDAIGIERSTGHIVLSISDHLDWVDVERHSTLMREKVDSYLRFVSSGEIFQSYPKARSRQVVIRVYCKYRIPDNVEQLLLNWRKIAESFGAMLEWERLE